MPEPTFAPNAAASLDVVTLGEMPQLPDAVEARVWILTEGDGLTQKQIARRENLSQGNVSRALARATTKIATLVDGGWLTRETLERRLRKAVGLAART